jgi:hypothetical protein
MTQGNQTKPFNVDELRERLQKMCDPELRTFGQAAQHMVSPKAQLGEPTRKVFVIQLEDHWRRNRWNAWAACGRRAVGYP